jgi:hypothetical protein
MRKIIFILLFIPMFSTAQDNDNTKVTVTLQARDCEFIGSFIAFNESFEDMFDGMKLKFRVTSPPQNTTNVVIDTIPIGQWLALSAKLRTDPYAIGGSVWARYDAALRAANNTYMTGRLNTMDANDTDIFTGYRVLGRFRLRKQ